jgi:hypothetical protein
VYTDIELAPFGLYVSTTFSDNLGDAHTSTARLASLAVQAERFSFVLAALKGRHLASIRNSRKSDRRQGSSKHLRLFGLESEWLATGLRRMATVFLERRPAAHQALLSLRTTHSRKNLQS